MRVRSREYQIAYALAVASEPNANVGFFLPNRVAVVEAMEFAKGLSFYKFDSIRRTLTSPSGGVLRFFAAGTTDDINDTAGFQFSHIFADEALTPMCYIALRPKVRTRHKFEKASGFYSPWGAEVVIDY